MNIVDLPILKQLADLGAFEERVVRGVLNKQQVGAVNKRLLKRKVVKLGMKENEVRNVAVRKIANGFVFEISGTLYSNKYTHESLYSGRFGVSLSKAFFNTTRSGGSRSLEKNLAKFGGEIRELLLKKEREYEAELKKQEVKEKAKLERCKTGC